MSNEDFLKMMDDFGDNKTIKKEEKYIENFEIKIPVSMISIERNIIEKQIEEDKKSYTNYLYKKNFENLIKDLQNKIPGIKYKFLEVKNKNNMSIIFEIVGKMKKLKFLYLNEKRKNKVFLKKIDKEKKEILKLKSLNIENDFQNNFQNFFKIELKLAVDLRELRIKVKNLLFEKNTLKMEINRLKDYKKHWEKKRCEKN